MFRIARRHALTGFVFSSLLLATPWPVSGITIDVVYDTARSNSPGVDPNGGFIIPVMQEAARRWEGILDDSLDSSHRLEIRYFYDDFVIKDDEGNEFRPKAGATVVDADVHGARTTKGDIVFGTMLTSPWYFDQSPTDNDEFDMQQTLYGQLNAAQQASGFVGASPEPLLEVEYSGATNGTVALADGFDLLSTAMHEIGHLLGVTFSLPAGATEASDGDFGLPSLLLGGANMAGLAAIDDEGNFLPHLAHIGALMDVSTGPGERYLPTALDVLAMAEVSSWRSFDLPRKDFLTGSSWSTPGNWIGGQVPGADGTHDEVFIRHGGTVQLDANATAQSLDLGGGSRLDTNGNRLDVLTTTTLGADGTAPRIFIEPGGELVTENLVINGGDLGLTGGQLVVQDSLQITPTGATARLIGRGTVDVAGSLVNNGRIVADGGTLRFTTSSAGEVFGIDGLSGGGVVEAIGGSIEFDGDIDRDFAGYMTIGEGRYVEINNDWRVVAAGVLEMNGGPTPATAAELRGAELQILGVLDVDGHAVIAPKLTVSSFVGGVRVRNGASLQTNSVFLHNNGDLNVDPSGAVTMNSSYEAASSASGRIDGDVTFNSQARIAGTGITGTGGYSFNGVGAIWQAADVTIGDVEIGPSGSLVVRDSGTSLQSQQTTINGAMTVSRSATWVNSGTTTLNAGGTFDVSGGMFESGNLIATTGTTVNITGGDAVVQDFTKQSGASLQLSQGSFTIEEGTASLNSSFAFQGEFGNRPTFIVSDGGEAVVTTSWHIGAAAGGHGETIVTGAGSLLRSSSGGAAADLYVGRFGRGTLLVEDGGRVDFGDDFEIARDGADSSGLATIRGAADVFGTEMRSEVDVTRNGAAAALNVGRLGDGELNVEDGAIVRVGGPVSVGAGATGSGVLNLSGLSGNNSSAELYAPDSSVVIGRDAAGEDSGIVNILSGGRVTSRSLTIKSAGNLNINGGDLFVENFTRQTGGVFDLNGGTLRITGGDGVLNSAVAFGGPTPGLLGLTVVEVLDGADVVVTSSWHTGDLAGGTGLTKVAGVSADGARRSTIRGTVGGAGADFYVGRLGDGGLLVEDGGLVDLRDDFEIARESPDSTGMATIRGVANAGGQLIRSEVDVTGRGVESALVIGGQGDGRLNIESGALVRVAGPVAVATNPGSIGELQLVGFSEGFPAELSAVNSTVTVGTTGEGGANAEVNVFHGGLLTANRLTIQSNGIGRLLGGELDLGLLDITNAQAFNMTAGVLRADGVNGDLAPTGGIVAPGGPLGRMIINGTYTPTGDAALEIQIAGELAGSEHDQVIMDGFATLGGELHVSLVDSFMPTEGDVFTILIANSVTETFDALSLPTLAGDLGWQLRYTDNEVTLSVVSEVVSGDYNNDGLVDLGDFTIWRDSLGSTENLAADGDGDGVIGVGDYELWRSTFGMVANLQAASVANAPEPATLLCLFIPAICSLGGRHRPATGRGTPLPA